MKTKKKNKTPELCPAAAAILRLVQWYILKYPDQYNQNNPCAKTCGSPQCIIGWFDAIRKNMSFLLRGDEGCLTSMQHGRLFWPQNWPGKMRVPNLNGGEWDKITPKQACARIDRFIKSDGRE